MKLLERIYCNRQIKKLSAALSQIPSHRDLVSRMSDEELREAYQGRRRASKTRRAMQREMAFLFALFEEGFHRKLKITPYPEQFICANAMYQGFMAEMKTGEGKSIAAVLAALMAALHGRVHIVTVNDYLAARDYEKFQPIYDLFGLTSGANERDGLDKAALYQSDVVHSSSAELIFDYLRNELLPVQRRISFPLDTVIIDEVDFVLLDNATSNFSIGTGINHQPEPDLYIMAKDLFGLMKGEERDHEDEAAELPDPEDAHYVYYTYNRTSYLTERGQKFLDEFLKSDNLIMEHFKLYKIILNTLDAHLFYHNGRDYIVHDGKVVLVNRENGRLMPSSQLEVDLHSAIEVKEGVPISSKPLLSNSLSYQMFFIKYASMVGMSGTVHEASEEFQRLFRAPTVVIPTHRPNRRNDQLDLYFLTKAEKYEYLATHMRSFRRGNQPVLIITGSEKESLLVATLLESKGVKANLLNAQTVDREAELVRQAGIHDQITISTNIAGRGTDIILDPQAKWAGGLQVIVLNRYASRRIDNQARGRAGRQGEVGECIFYLSLEDDLFAHMGPSQAAMVERLKARVGANNRFGIKASRMLTQIIDHIQNTVQGQQFKQRQTNFSLDQVIERQRHVVGEWKETVKKSNPQEILVKFLKSRDFDRSSLERMWDNQKPGVKIDFNDLEGAICSQYERFGPELSSLLFKQLGEEVISREWLIYKRDLENTKNYLPLYRLDEGKMVTEYVHICFDQLKIFQQRAMNHILSYFLTAEISSRECVNQGG